MSHRLRPAFALATSALVTLALAGSAFAASRTAPLKLTSSKTKIYDTLTLSSASVRQLVDGGAQVTVPRDVGEHPLNVGLYAYGRALARGGLSIPKGLQGTRRLITPLAKVHVTSAGSHTVTLHVLPGDRAALLRAGSITLGIAANGY